MHIALVEEVNDMEQFSGQIWKKQREKIYDNIKITNTTVRRAYNKKSRKLGRR